MPVNITASDDGISFWVRVIPRASRSEVCSEHDGSLKVRVAAPPVDGAANAELVKLLAKQFKVAKSDIRIIVGETSRNKRVKISNITSSEFRERV